MNRTLALLVALSVCWFSALSAQAQTIDSTTRSTARQLGQEGVQAYQAGDYDLASERLERAYQLVKAPSLAFWSAQALEKRGKLVEASERYLEATRLDIEDTSQTAVQEKAKADAQTAHDSLAPRIPRLTLALHGATASELEVTLDGSLLPSALLQTKVPVNPGAHEVVARRGQQVARARFTLAEGSSTKVNLRFQGGSASAEAETAAAPGTGKAKLNVTGPVILLASGVVVMAIGIGLLVSSSCDPFYEYCDADSSPGAGGAGLIALGAGATIAGGVWLGVKLHKHKRATAGVSLLPLPAGAGLAVSGRF